MIIWSNLNTVIILLGAYFKAVHLFLQYCCYPSTYNDVYQNTAVTIKCMYIYMHCLPFINTLTVLRHAWWSWAYIFLFCTFCKGIWREGRPLYIAKTNRQDMTWCLLQAIIAKWNAYIVFYVPVIILACINKIPY